jgi:hypothetical protein
MSIYDKSSLVLIPSGTKAGKVYSQKPVSGDGDFTFTRSSAATRVNADGNIEKETSNLLTYSNTFSSWTPANAVLTGGQSGYDGTSDAWLLDKAASAGNIQLNVSSSGVNTFSYYAKAGSVDWTRLLILGTTNASTYINLTNGAIGVGGGGFIDATATDVGSGWWRVSITHSTAITQVRIYPAPADNDTSGSSGNIYIQDAQLNQGLIAQEVITTTTSAVYGGITDNTPRLDYTDSSCPALLLEPQRTNVVTQSEYYDTGNGYFNSFALHDIVTNTTATKSPTGDYSASKIIPDTSNSSNHNIYGSNVTSGTKYAVSIFAKAAEYNYLLIRGLGLGGSGGARFNISTGVVEGVAGYDSATIEDYGNGWYRCIAVGTATSTTGAYYHASPTAAFTSFQGNNSDGIYIYGAQIEAGSYATSYIPTYGSSVTRVGETNSVTGVSDIIGQEQGTFFVEWENIGDTSRPYLALSAGGSTANRVLIYESSGVNAQIKSGGSVVFQSTTASVSGTIKAAVAYNTNDFVFYVNGTQYGTDSSGATFSGTTLSEIEFDHAGLIGASIKQSLVFKTRLTNSELADLTTL